MMRCVVCGELSSVFQLIERQCAEMLYSTNTFLLFVTYGGISFRFRWLLPSGLAPSRSYNFVELLPQRYLRLIKRIVVHVDHVDSYTGKFCVAPRDLTHLLTIHYRLGMIKFNVDGNGLTYGLQSQVQRLVNKLQASNGSDLDVEDRRLAKVLIRVSNGNAVLDALKSNIVRQREGRVKVSEDIEEMLEPFGQLRGVQQAQIRGAVTDMFARRLEARMMSERCIDETTMPNPVSGPWQAKDVTPGAFASSDDKRKTNLANLIRGF